MKKAPAYKIPTIVSALIAIFIAINIVGYGFRSILFFKGNKFVCLVWIIFKFVSKNCSESICIFV
ncbi:hypothetical protein [Campylobacter concisus]|uniref:hypothetical protein n=1 Tax=Campylobacter concisus TaxID=199 RepID=UPI00142E93A2|nr:hypothetical protein [Campylobacter concisus]